MQIISDLPFQCDVVMLVCHHACVTPSFCREQAASDMLRIRDEVFTYWCIQRYHRLTCESFTGMGKLSAFVGTTALRWWYLVLS